MNPQTPDISIQDLSVRFQTASGSVLALDNVSFDIPARSFLTIVGPSGCGKTTLLKVLSGVMQPSAGRVLFDGQPVDPQRVTGQVGYVFQRPLLLPWRTALDNVMLTMEVARKEMTRKERRDEAQRWLEIVGLKGFEHRYPGELSGGMQQRVAIARALSLSPRLILADEPTGNLDTHSADEIFELLQTINRERQSACLIVTHDPRLAQRCQRQIRIVDGQLV